jgi:6,7-dimethyl-8-ribityllumazine synthase
LVDRERLDKLIPTNFNPAEAESMPSVFKGETHAGGERFAIVVSRYNESITRKLLDGAVETLASRGVEEHAIVIAWVPGAWELPLVAQQFAAQETFAAVICLGAVIKGETTHDQHINTQVAQSLGQLALDFDVPVLFGVLTCNTYEQAEERAGGIVGNKGSECALAALEMAHLLAQLRR